MFDHYFSFIITDISVKILEALINLPALHDHRNRRIAGKKQAHWQKATVREHTRRFSPVEKLLGILVPDNHRESTPRFLSDQKSKYYPILVIFIPNVFVLYFTRRYQWFFFLGLLPVDRRKKNQTA